MSFLETALFEDSCRGLKESSLFLFCGSVNSLNWNSAIIWKKHIEEASSDELGFK